MIDITVRGAAVGAFDTRARCSWTTSLGEASPRIARSRNRKGIGDFVSRAFLLLFRIGTYPRFVRSLSGSLA